MAFFSGVMGRLRPEIIPAQTEAELTALYQRMQPGDQPSPHPGEAPPKPTHFRILVGPGAQGLGAVRRQFGQPLALALAVVGVVLLIAAVNVANLLLARGAARTTELATRAALGAGRARLMRLLALEGAALAAAGRIHGSCSCTAGHACALESGVAAIQTDCARHRAGRSRPGCCGYRDDLRGPAGGRLAGVAAERSGFAIGNGGRRPHDRHSLRPTHHPDACRG